MTGSRTWPERIWLYKHLDAAFAETLYMDRELVIVHGHCKEGADAMADDWAIEVGCPVERHPADWTRYGRSAGMHRNAQMVMSKPHACIAFIHNNSSGATHCKDMAEKYRILTHVARL